jgi:hypothetical protein
VRKREDANHAREVEHLDKIEGIVANMLNCTCDDSIAFSSARLFDIDLLTVADQLTVYGEGDSGDAL